METINLNKIAILKLKESIKKASEKQKFYKDQRKTDHNKLPREISPSEASWKHASNREILRIMYLAYALLRGKDFSETDKNYQDVSGNKILAKAEMYEKEAQKDEN